MDEPLKISKGAAPDWARRGNSKDAGRGNRTETVATGDGTDLAYAATLWKAADTLRGQVKGLSPSTSFVASVGTGLR